MIGVVARKELIVLRRDGRVLALLGLIGAMALLALLTAWATHVKHEHQVHEAQAGDAAAFLRQGRKPSHSAAHFGRMAYKPPVPLAILDPGAAPYLGQVIWLEAHRQDPAMFRPAEDAPELSRLSDLSVAGVLTTLLPLLVFVMGYGVFASERERGTWRQVMTAGASQGSLFAGKLVAVAGLGVAVASIVVAITTAVAVVTGESSDTSDTALRGIGMLIGFASYASACAGIALAVSAVSRTATSALLVLLTVWAVAIIVVPRVAASAGELVYPTPEGSTFWTDTSEAIRDNRPKRGSDALRRVEQQVVSLAIGRELPVGEATPTNLNRAALGQEISEVLGAQIYAEAYAALYATYDRQRDARRMAAILSPAIALSHWSAALAGTDLAAHRHFAGAAEQQRQQLIRRINEDMMVNGAGQGYDYLPAAEFWKTLPDFTYRRPPVGFAVRSAILDLLLLLGWAGLAIGAAWQVARRQRAI